ncbi:ribulose-phosphate 3-epimerase [Candidatus Peregrinibacteria bacterium]|nr:ribulose-phosphate 3-epimerase [Candidatus Peregrinibacteria bacterium]
MPNLQIFPSLLSADFGKLQSEIDRFEPYVEGFHFDVMDGHFVPNLTMGAPVLKSLHTKTLFDVHLMVEHPEEYVEDFQKAGAKMISFHVEAAKENSSNALIQQIQNLGMKAGIVLKPKTPCSEVESFLDAIDFVMIMSVEPGYSGQKFMPEVLPKIREIREKYPEMDIEVDGGINDETVREVVEAGANMIVSASYLFGAKNGEEAVRSLRL